MNSTDSTSASADDRAAADAAAALAGRTREASTTVSVPEEATIAIPRTDLQFERELDQTVAVHRPAQLGEAHSRQPDERTVVVDRSSRAPGSPADFRKTPAFPGAPSTNRVAIAASGPGSISHYVARRIPPQPEPPRTVVFDPAFLRQDSSLPSVARRSRRTAVAALSAVATACVVSVVGLITLLRMVFA